MQYSYVSPRYATATVNSDDRKNVKQTNAMYGATGCRTRHAIVTPIDQTITRTMGGTTGIFTRLRGLLSKREMPKRPA